jgi:hypothetical protein
MPRFVLLYHACPPDYIRPSHWDFMLESGEALRTWALYQLPRAWAAAHAQTGEIDPQCPELADDDAVPAEQLGEHRRNYLEYEGELSDHRGRVKRVAAGTFKSDAESAASWQLTLEGASIEGQIRLSRTGAEQSAWTLMTMPS